ncbi:MAG: EamA family transporter [Chloroflexi bacterium]|nr:EamA family transporter [Chloroflexota bacterium]
MGEFLSLISGFSFAASNVYTRRGVYFSRESFSPLPISMGIGIFLFFISVLVSGGGFRLAGLSSWGVFTLSAAGIIHFVIGRGFNYTSLRLIGANRTQPLMATNVLFAVGFAMVFLGESVGPVQAFGVMAVFLGVVLVGTSSAAPMAGAKTDRRTLLKGMAAGLGSGICYGISPLFVRVGVREIGSPFAGGLVSYLAAGLVVLVFLMREEHRRWLLKLPRPAAWPMVIGGATVAAAQILRYAALSFSPVNVVTPLTSTNNIFVPFLSWLLNRKMEAFSVKVLAGTAAVVFGVSLILLF